eukprot:gene18846-6222_t
MLSAAVAENNEFREQVGKLTADLKSEKDVAEGTRRRCASLFSDNCRLQGALEEHTNLGKAEALAQNKTQ